MMTPGANGAIWRQRGATLTSYAVILTMMVVAAVSSLEFLVNDSEQFLVDSGSSIGSPPPDRDLGFDPTLVAPAGWTRTEPGEGQVGGTVPIPSTTTTTVPPSTTAVSTTSPSGSSSSTSPSTTPLSTTSTTGVSTTSTTSLAPLFVDAEVGTFASGKCLGLSRGELRQVWCGSSSVELITAQPLATGGIELRLHNGKCLGLPGSTKNNTKVVEMSCGAAGSTWNSSGPAPFTLTNGKANTERGQDMCMDLKGGSSSSGTSVVIWPCQGGPNQTFNLP